MYPTLVVVLVLLQESLLEQSAARAPRHASSFVRRTAAINVDHVDLTAPPTAMAAIEKHQFGLP